MIPGMIPFGGAKVLEKAMDSIDLGLFGCELNFQDDLLIISD